jgi:hypothetical protein
MLAIIRVTDRVLVIELVSPAGEDAALIDLDDVADALDHPFDAAVAAWLAVAVVHGGKHDELGAHGVGLLNGADLQTNGMRVKIGVIAGARRFGVGGDDIAGRPEMGKVAGVLRHAETAAQGAEAAQQQPQPQTP